MVAENVPHMLNQAAWLLRKIFVPQQQKLRGRSDRNGSKADVLAGVDMVLQAVSGPPTLKRKTVLKVALAIAQFKGILKVLLSACWYGRLLAHVCKW